LFGIDYCKTKSATVVGKFHNEVIKRLKEEGTSMIIEICCLWLSLVSVSSSDLIQTSWATARGFHEVNPLTDPIVKGKSSVGEVGLGVTAIAGIATLERLRKTRVGWLSTPIELAWLAGHAWALQYNQKNGTPAGTVIFPVFLLQW
jgi:hypothetical protein